MEEKETIYDASLDAKMEDRSITELIREDGKDILVTNGSYVGKISKYKYKILVRDQPALEGELSRDEMDMIYRLYTSEGGNLTQRAVSRYFPTLTFRDFKRIMRAFNITKSSVAMAPHIVEEKSIEDLMEITTRNKENNYLKKYEQDKSKLIETRYRELLKELSEKNDQFVKMSEVISDVKEYPLFKKDIKHNLKSSQDLILHLSDLHIGAKVRKNSIYENEYNYQVVKSRLETMLSKLQNKKYDTIIINLLGDMLDGMKQQTARQDHFLPQNLDDFEQITAYLEIMEWFLVSLHNLNICNNIKVYSVKCGNHDGISAYTATVALFNKMKLILPQYEYILFTEFFGFYEFKNHKFIICHGKEDEFMKRGMPLNIDDKNKVMIYNWLDSQGIYGNNIHFIKGDLHSDNLNSSYKMDYRNCLSLFGASDYANYNFERNNYGVSYEILDGEELLHGTYINL